MYYDKPTGGFQAQGLTVAEDGGGGSGLEV